MLSKAYLFKDNRWNEKLDKTFDSRSTLIVCFGCSDYLKIVEKHSNGKLEVENIEFVYEHKKYKGACFKIFLPKYQ